MLDSKSILLNFMNFHALVIATQLSGIVYTGMLFHSYEIRDVGRFALVIGVINIISMVFNINTRNYIIKNYEKIKENNSWVSMFIIDKGASLIAMICYLMIIEFYMDFMEIKVERIFIIASTLIYVIRPLGYIQGTLYAEKLFKTIGTISVISALARLAVASMVIYFELSIEYMIFAILADYTVSYICSIIIADGKGIGYPKRRRNVKWDIKDAIQFAFFSSYGVVTRGGLKEVFIQIIGLKLGENVVGIFTAITTLNSAILGMIESMRRVIYPSFVEIGATQLVKNVGQYVFTAFKIYLLLLAVGMLAFITIGENALEIIFASNGQKIYNLYILIFPFVLARILTFGLQPILFTLNEAKSNLRIEILAALSSAIIFYLALEFIDVLAIIPAIIGGIFIQLILAINTIQKKRGNYE